MSKRHQSSRRRTYGRRQHELHERPERPERPERTVGSLSWIDESHLSTTGDGWEVRVLARTAAGDWLDSRGLD